MTWTFPDSSSMLDIGLTVFFIAFIPIAALANTVNIPLFGRTAGLLTYSKFSNGISFALSVPTKVGMLILYGPAGLLGAYIMMTAASEGRGTLAGFLMLVHFGKRCLECLFVHKYSGSMPLQSSLFICTFYTLTSFVTCHYSALAPSATLSGNYLTIGCLMFAVGLAGNFYHHVLLANLRKPGEKAYKIPSGGCFEYVAAPHYFFELIGWLGVAFVSQNFIVLLAFGAMSSYLSERSVAQSAWNRAKLDGYPQSRKHIVPFLF